MRPPETCPSPTRRPSRRWWPGSWRGWWCLRAGQALAGLWLVAAGCPARAQAPAELPPPAVEIGVLAPEGPAQAAQAWSHLEPYLEAAVPGQRFHIRTFDLPTLGRAVATGSVDFFIANSGFYVDMEAAHGASRIATLQSPQASSPTEAIASAVIVRRGRDDLRTLADLQGRRLVAVSERAFGGFQVAWRELRRAGVDPFADLASLRFTGFPMQQVVLAVRRGDADAGIVRACLLESMVQQGQVAEGEFAVLDPQPGAFPCQRSTPLYPDWPFASLKHTPHDLAKRVATALLAMPATENGHGWTVATDYQPVRELFRDLEIGPYADLHERSLKGFVQRQWAWFALAGALLAAWLIHSLRVERLVHARTAELRLALEQRAQMEREARAQQDKLDHLSRLGILGEMSSMLAHELNQPLAAIGNFARGMARRLEAGRVDAAPLLQASHEIADQAERAGGIMQRIRGFVGKRAAVRERVHLGETLEGAVSLFGSMLTHPPAVALQMDPRCTDPWVLADRLQVEQVLLNLLKNALDAMQALPPPQRRIVVECSAADDHFRVAVSDNGSGLDAASADRLFEPFFTTKPDGVGLGLAICQRVVEAHGGRIWAAPAPQGGLSVCFTLPRTSDAPHHPAG